MDIRKWGLWASPLIKCRSIFEYVSGWAKRNHQLAPQLPPSPHLLFSFPSSLKFIIVPPPIFDDYGGEEILGFEDYGDEEILEFKELGEALAPLSLCEEEKVYHMEEFHVSPYI